MLHFLLIVISTLRNVRVRIWRSLAPLQERATLINITRSIIEQFHFAINLIVFVTLVSMCFSYFRIYSYIGTILNITINKDVISIISTIQEILHVACLFFVVVYYILATLLKRSPLQGKDWLAAASDENFRKRIREWLLGNNLPKEATGSENCYVFASTPIQVRELTEINYEAFAGTQFGFSKRKMYHRNLGIACKNNKTFMVIYDPLLFYCDILGFTCVLPFNEAATRAYVDGAISDKRIFPEYISSVDEIPFSLIVFSICVRKKFRKIQTDSTANYLYYILSLVSFHIRMVGQHVAADHDILIYAQAEKGGMKRILERYGFENTGKITNDGCKLFATTIKKYSRITSA